jgi:hypothetical protein
MYKKHAKVLDTETTVQSEQNITDNRNPKAHTHEITAKIKTLCSN